MSLTKQNETKELKQALSLSKIISEKFSGHEIRVDKDTGYICVSDICKAANSEWSRYSKLKGSKAFIEELSTSLRIGRDLRIGRTLLIKKITSGVNEIRGTWAHQRIALHMCFNKFPKFAMFVMDIVERFASGDLKLAEEVIQRHDSLNDTNTTFTSRASVRTGERITIADSIPNEELKNNTKKAIKVEKQFKRLEVKYKRLKAKANNLEINYDETSLIVWEQCSEIDQLMIELKENEKKADEERKKSEERFQALMVRTQHIVDQNEDLHEEIIGVSSDILEVEEKLDTILPNHVSLEGVRPGEKEIIVISRFTNVNPRVSTEKPFLVYKGQLRSVGDVRKGHVADLTAMRQERLRRNLRRSEIPKITELFRVGDNGYIPNAKKTWTPFKRTNRRYLRFSRKKTTMFALRNGWSIINLKTALEAKDQNDRS